MNGSEIVDSPISKAFVCAGDYAYLRIPAAELRGVFDSAFPTLAKNGFADCASGYMHRFAAGHDLLIDVPKTLVNHGPAEAGKHLGHILVTDFPTKAGIPIPGLSESGLGHWLTETVGIPKPYLCINIMDATVGLFACTEGTLDIVKICANHVRMSPEVFIDTFVEGGLEVAGGVHFQSAPLVIAGAENIAAGLCSLGYTITHPIWFVGFCDFAGGVLAGGLLSLLISRFILKKKNDECLRDVLKSISISSLFAVANGFGIAGLIAMVACNYGKLLARIENARREAYFKFSREKFLRFFECIPRNCPEVSDWIMEFERTTEPYRLPEYRPDRPSGVWELLEFHGVSPVWVELPEYRPDRPLLDDWKFPVYSVKELKEASNALQ